MAAALVMGTLAGVGAGSHPALPAVWTLAGAGLLAALRRRPRARWTAAAALAAGLAGIVQGASLGAAPPPVAVEEVAAPVGTVARAADFLDAPAAADDPAEREAVFRLAADSPSALLVARVAYREGDLLPPLLPGDRVRLVGRVEPLRPPSNPGEPDRRGEWARERISGEIRVASPGAVTALPPAELDLATGVRRAGEIARRALLERLTCACGGPGPAAALLGCLLLGDRSGLDPATSAAFRDSGTGHLLSVSGLHVVLLAAAARRLARALVPRRVRRRFAVPSVVALLFGYCALCRFATPVVRAAVFLAVAAVTRAGGRRPSPFDTLWLAAALVVGADPAQVLDPSFQLSFAAVAGLALYTRGLRAALFPALALYRKFPGAIPARRLWLMEHGATAIATSLAASAATAPVVARVFGRLQPAAPVANLVAVPLAAFLVPLAAVLAITGPTAPGLTAPLAAAAVAPLRASTAAASAIPGATIETGPAPLALCALACALLVVAAFRIVRRPREAALLLAVSWILLAAAPLVRNDPARPEFVALDVGHGSCVLALSPDGGAVVFDAGGHAGGIGRRTIVPALRALGVRWLGAVFLSHQDADHCGAALDILDAFRVGEVVVSPGFGSDRLPAAIVARCRARGVPVTVTVRGDVWARRGCAVRVLSPGAEPPPPSDNEASIVAYVRLGEGADAIDAVLPGDIEGDALHALASDPTAPVARLLLLPHHGRGDPASQLELVRRLHAAVLVASTSSSAPMTVPGALVTGIDGAVRVRPGEAPAAFPWDEP